MLLRTVSLALCSAWAASASVLPQGPQSRPLDGAQDGGWSSASAACIYSSGCVSMQEEAIPYSLSDDRSQRTLGVLDQYTQPKVPGHLPIPHRPPENVRNRTIYQILSDTPQLSRIFKLVNFTEDITNLLNDSSANVTFFAPPNSALHPPRHPKHPEVYQHLAEQLFDEPLFSDEADRIPNLEPDHLDLLAAAEAFLTYDRSSTEYELIKPNLARIIRGILLYHILPSALPAAELAKNITHATNLSLEDGSLDGEPIRIRVQEKVLGFPPALAVNEYARIIKSDIRTLNGIIHVVNHPLLPPPSVFEITFLFPNVFSTLTSALGRVGLIDEVDLRHAPGGDDTVLAGTPAVTFFAPTNKAFDKLPKKLRFFLFSRYGEKALKKLLQFHILPGLILHSNWLHNVTEADVTAEAPYANGVDGNAHGPYQPQVHWNLDAYSMIVPAVPNHVIKPKLMSGTKHRSRLCSLRNMEENERPSLCYGDCDKQPQPPKSQQLSPLPLTDSQHPRGPQIVYAFNVSASTLLNNHPMHVHVAQFELKRPLLAPAYVTHLSANGQFVRIFDIVARNGALQVVDTLLKPIHREHTHRPTEEGTNAFHNHFALGGNDDWEDWEDWEDWLPDWANAE
ncbi:hypothetical protein AcV5_005843 [Taiwanofungus camphoratus]|nr:hypothetical protein AcV5_005843 [Antrodia cinnamomea]